MPSSPRTTRISLVSYKCQSVPNNKETPKRNILRKFVSKWYYNMYDYVCSSKVTHAKYAVAEKADYCDTRIEKFITTAKLYFCIELQDFELMMNDV